MKTLLTLTTLTALLILPRCTNDRNTYVVTYTEQGEQRTDTITAEYFEKAMFGGVVTFHSMGEPPRRYEHTDTIRQLK